MKQKHHDVSITDLNIYIKYLEREYKKASEDNRKLRKEIKKLKVLLKEQIEEQMRSEGTMGVIKGC